MRGLDSLEFAPRVSRRRPGPPDSDGQCVVYWMQRSQRTFDNPALNLAVDAGNLLGKPVVVYFQLVPRLRHANLRHYTFLVQGLGDIAAGLKKRGIGFVVWRYPQHGLTRFCAQVRPCLVVGDENPLREAERVKVQAAQGLSVPFWTVDSDVIVPTKLLGKEHYAARTIRPKIHALLKEFLQPLSNPRAKFQWRLPADLHSLAPGAGLLHDFAVDRSVEPVASFMGGSEPARATLRRFIRERLKGYAVNRNRPDLDGTSQLSPYLHFGHIGPHTLALAVQTAGASLQDRRSFLEELIVRRELAMNFVRYNRHYDSFDASEPWADRTLCAHAGDERRHLYSETQLENAATHDPLWNAAQKQMVLAGWMHGYVRMYWAKKILEWTPTPAAAYEIAVRLNDKYELDGRDPNGYAGIAWAIVGKHDRAWGPERPVYGKIRYMSYASTSRKFDSQAYIRRVAAWERGGESLA